LSEVKPEKSPGGTSHRWEALFSAPCFGSRPHRAATQLLYVLSATFIESKRDHYRSCTLMATACGCKSATFMASISSSSTAVAGGAMSLCYPCRPVQTNMPNLSNFKDLGFLFVIFIYIAILRNSSRAGLDSPRKYEEVHLFQKCCQPLKSRILSALTLEHFKFSHKAVNAAGKGDRRIPS
jgi:hypothetical protein